MSHGMCCVLYTVPWEDPWAACQPMGRPTGRPVGRRNFRMPSHQGGIVRISVVQEQINMIFSDFVLYYMAVVLASVQEALTLVVCDNSSLCFCSTRTSTQH